MDEAKAEQAVAAGVPALYGCFQTYLRKGAPLIV